MILRKGRFGSIIKLGVSGRHALDCSKPAEMRNKNREGKIENRAPLHERET